MGIFLKAAFGVILAGVLYGYLQLNKVTEPPVFPNTWWGSRDPAKEDSRIKPFKIDVSQDVISDLKQRLDTALPFHPPLEGVNQHYGMNTKLLQKIVNYWKNDYLTNWTARQKFLNQYPQYTVSIQGLNIHYIHVKPNVEKSAGLKVVPLLILHGWPGSVREFYEIIPYLTQPQKGRKVVFEVIAPSLPGYGFSEATNKPGMSPVRMGQIFVNLMKEIGFEKFYVQGGDWGAIILQTMLAIYPQNVLGAHSNLCFSMKMSSNIKMWLLGSIYPPLIATEEEIPLIFPLGKKTFQDVILLEMGYNHIQSTKPDTIGVALRDSPAGLAAYILEKFTTWTNPAWKDLEDGGLTKKFTMDQLLDNVMIYWVTRSITTSMRLYSEMFRKDTLALNLDEIPIRVPTACARFKNEISILPESTLREKFLNLTQITLHPDGGHFAAFEVPEILANDIYNFIETII